MKTEDLIVELARHAAAVRVLPPPVARAARWLAGAALAVAAMVWAIGVRADVLSMFASRALVAEGLLGLATAVLAGWTALALAVPGALTGRALRAAGLVAGAAWLGAVLVRLAATGAPIAALAREPNHPVCVLSVLLLALAPGAGLFAMQRRGAALQPAWSAGLVALAALAVSSVGVQLHCPISLPAHVLLWHLGPVIAGSAIAALAARRTSPLNT